MQKRDLERTLGVAVVERRQGDVMLTDVGREIVRRTDDVLDAAMLALPLGETDIDTIALFEDLFLLAVPTSDPRSETTRIAVSDIDQSRLILLEDGHCLRDQALAFCATATRGRPASAGGYDVMLIPQIAADVERRDDRVKFLRLENPQPGCSIGLAFRSASPRKADFAALGEVVKESVEMPAARTAGKKRG